MIEAQGLSMRYGPVVALEDATFRAERGEVVGLLGPNGAGKSTAMRILTTYQLPTAGTARVAGFDVQAQPLEVRRRIGYLPENLPLYLDMEVRESLRFVGRARGLRGAELERRVGWVVERCALDPVFRTPCLELSKGYRQRTALAQALVHDPEVVILDEPTTGLDPRQILDIRGLIRELAREKTVILSTHILQEASALTDRLIVVSHGQIVGQGTEAELREQAGVKPLVRVVVAPPVPDAAARLAELPAAGAVAGDEAAGRYEVEERHADLVAQVGGLARDAGWTLTELVREPGRLERVFLELTSRAAPVSAREAAA